MDGHDPGSGLDDDAPVVAPVDQLDEFVDDQSDVQSGDDDYLAELEAERQQFLSTVAKVFSAVIVGLCCIYVFWVVHPELVFRNTTPKIGRASCRERVSSPV